MSSAVSSLANFSNNMMPGAQGANQYTFGLANPGANGGYANGIFSKLAPQSADAPNSPGINSNLQNVQAQQLQNAQSFRANMPSMNAQLTNQMNVQGGNALGQNLQNINSGNSARGLMYGGINAGQQQGARAQMATGLAQGKSEINSNLANAANTLDAQAVQTGMGVQASQNQIENQVYSQAMSMMNLNNSYFGGLMSGGGKIGGMMAAGG